MNAHFAPSPEEAVGLYVHVPFCESKCRYCGFYSEPTAGRNVEALVSTLIAELSRYRAVASIRTLYIGGGSPTSLPSACLARLAEAVASVAPDCREFTVECNPGQTDTQMLSMLRQCGVNRLSFGVQSFHDDELARLGRRHRADEAVRSIQQALDLGFDNVGLDLIFAVPGSTVALWQRSLETATSLGVQHISAYSLSFEPGTALDEARRAGQVEAVDEDTDRAMYESAIDYLAAAGFVQYEISNFARAGFSCLHNRGYWENRPYIGIGPSAGSYWQGRRSVNISDIRQYMHRVENDLVVYDQCDISDERDRICETAVLNLRTRQGVDLAAFRRMTGVRFEDVFAGPLERYRRCGLIEVEGQTVRLARKSLAVADSVLCDFAAF